MNITPEPAAKMIKNDTVFQANGKNGVYGNGHENENGNSEVVAVEEMTSKDYYFDSYAHFGIHEGNT